MASSKESFSWCFGDGLLAFQNPGRGFHYGCPMFRLLILLAMLLSSQVARAVEHEGLRGKVFCGYQGWFRAEGDGTGLGWVHFGPGKKFAPGVCSFDLWPDLSEFDSDELYPSPFAFEDGSEAKLFSSANPKTVRRHFRWMRESGISGAFVQRFATQLLSPKMKKVTDLVLSHCTDSASAEGVSLTVMYDLSGLPADKFSAVFEDWKALVESGQLKQRCAQMINGKPLVAIWGIGFSDRDPALNEWENLIDGIRDTGCAVMLGVPAYWRSLKNDSITDVRLHQLLLKADVLSPWTVGRCSNPKSVEALKANIWAPDLEWCVERKKEYMPVVFPGFSWRNLSAARGKEFPLNQIPRLKGDFFWKQIVEAKVAGAETLYVAMFDEIDEGTAVMKCGGRRPVGESSFVDLSDVPSDHYLWLSGQAGRLLRGEVLGSEVQPARVLGGG